MSVAEIIERKINELIRDQTDQSFVSIEHRKYAKRYHVLPVTSDMFGIYALHLDGTVVWFDFEDSGKPTSELSTLYQNMVLLKASRKYPELSFLAPQRPVNAKTCEHCNGTGKRLEPKYEKLPCNCGGVGWMIE